jgi:hypothetical protein
MNVEQKHHICKEQGYLVEKRHKEMNSGAENANLASR